MTTSEIVAIAGVIGGLLLNVAVAAYGYGALNSTVRSLDMRLGTMHSEWERRMQQVLQAMEELSKQANHHSTRIALIENRCSYIHFRDGEPEAHGHHRAGEA